MQEAHPYRIHGQQLILSINIGLSTLHKSNVNSYVLHVVKNYFPANLAFHPIPTTSVVLCKTVVAMYSYMKNTNYRYK